MTWYGSMSHEFLRHIFAFCLGLVSNKWWRHQMETFSALLAIYAGNSPVPGEFPALRPVTRSFDISFDLRRNKRLNKQSWGWWFETLLRPLWRQCNEFYPCISLSGAGVVTAGMIKPWTVFVIESYLSDILIIYNDQNKTKHNKKHMHMGQVMKLRLSCYLVLLSIDSKTR